MKDSPRRALGDVTRLGDRSYGAPQAASSVTDQHGTETNTSGRRAILSSARIYGPPALGRHTVRAGFEALRRSAAATRAPTL